MNLKRVSVLAALFAAGAVNLLALGQTGDQPPKKDPPPTAKPATPPAPAQGLVGKPAPDFAAKDLDGNEHKLADHKGEIVVLQWLSVECPVCNTHLKDKKTMQNTFSQFKGKGVVWLAVDSTPSEVANTDKIKSFSKEAGISYPILVDKDARTAKAYGAKTAPHMFVIDKNGIIAYEGAIDSDPSMKDAKPTNYVQAALQALVDGSQVSTKWTKPYGSELRLDGSSHPGHSPKEKDKGTDKP